VAPEEGQWGVPELQTKVIKDPIMSATIVTADDEYDGLKSVIIYSQPVWNHITARTGQALVFNDGGEIWINTNSERMPRMILLECSNNVSDNLQANSMLLSLTNGVITAMTAFFGPSGNIAKRTTFSGMSVTNQNGVLKIFCNPELCKFYYNSYSQVFDYYDCYLMY
jgi:hypothetical protein